MSAGLNSSDARERGRAVFALSRSKDHGAAVRTLIEILRRDSASNVRIEATAALGVLGGADATAVLLEKAASTDESIVRISALEAIATIRNPAAVSGLINLFRLNRGQDDLIVHFGAGRALIKIGAPGVPQLLQALSDSSASVRRGVVAVLGRIGPPEVADRIAGLQSDPDLLVQSAAKEALATLKAPKP